jgi:hypothetical protein
LLPLSQLPTFRRLWGRAKKPWYTTLNSLSPLLLLLTWLLLLLLASVLLALLLLVGLLLLCSFCWHCG